MKRWVIQLKGWHKMHVERARMAHRVNAGVKYSEGCFALCNYSSRQFAVAIYIVCGGGVVQSEVEVSRPFVSVSPSKPAVQFFIFIFYTPFYF